MERKIQHDAQVALEQPFLKVPFEALSRAFRNTRKIIDKEVQFIQNNLASEEQIEASIKRLQQFKRKIQEANAEEAKMTKKLKVRVSQIAQFYTIQEETADEYQKYSKVRLYRLIIDYLLRNGHHETAKAFMKSTAVIGDSGAAMEDLVDVDIFSVVQSIEKSLVEGRSSSECLAWCQDNKGGLKKLSESLNLEYQLREQEFVMLVKDKKLNEAIAYAKKYFAPFKDSHIKQIQKVMVILAFHQKSASSVAEEYFSEDRWKMLASAFKRDIYALNALPDSSILDIVIQSGLPALKTPSCYSGLSQKNIHCPVCQNPFNKLAEKLPFAHHINSCCVCRVTGEIMDENNPCMVLPNGSAYSNNGIQTLIKRANNINPALSLGFGTNRFLDERTKEWTNLSSVKKAFLM